MDDTENRAEAGRGEDSREIVVRVFGRTDVGLVREHNEDNFLIADLERGNRSIMPEVRTHTVGPKGSVFAVCDGMGGAAAGEVASNIGVDTIYEILQDGPAPETEVQLARKLNEAICEAGRRIYTAAKLNRGQRGMGTTVTAAVLNGPRLIVGQVGDSRAHIVRRGELVQVTKDQSLVQQLIDAKQLTVEEAREFDRSNIILQALGTAEEVHVDVTSVSLRRNDALILCSDGLSGRVEPDTIREVVTSTDDPMEACRKLTELACANGGDDNITVIVVRFDGAGLEEGDKRDSVAYERFEFRQNTETTARSSHPKIPHANGESSKNAGETTAFLPKAGGASTAAGATSPDAGRRSERPHGKESGRGVPKIAIVASICALICAGLGYAFVRGAGGQASETSDAAVPRVEDAAAEAPVLLAPAPAGGVVPTEPHEPQLAPVDESRILKSSDDELAGGGWHSSDRGERSSEAASRYGSNRDSRTSKPRATGAAASKEKSTKSGSSIEENPY